jgi:outer membrane lipoprotein-sorting protein
MRHPVAVALLLAAAVSHGADERSPGDAPVADLEALTHLFATSGGVRAEFQESRHLAILEAPLETEGVLYFAPPDRLARYTTRPGRTSIVVIGSGVTLRDETGVQRLDLESSEVARSLIDNLAILLRGDLDAMRERYEIRFRANAEPDDASRDTSVWTLDLVPRSRVVRSLIERIRVEGRGGKLSAMETLEANGDRTVTAFTAVETGLDFQAEDLARFFSPRQGDDAP